MLERRIEGIPVVVLAIAFLTALFAGCSRPAPPHGVEERAELLELHLADIRAHRAGDVEALMATIPAEFRVVADGETFLQTRDEVEAFFTKYLEGAVYTRYEDLQLPHAEVSPDGNMGWVTSRMAVERSEPDGVGGRRTRAFEYAGIMTWEKTDGHWMKVANVSTFVPESGSDHDRLASLFHEDQLVRTQDDHRIARSDGERRDEVMAMLAAGTVRTPRDRFHAAMILQHTGLSFCDGELTSLSAENYLLAHHLALAAFEAGEIDARWLVAASIDRYLGFTSGTQKYGTNRVINQETGAEELLPIDRNVTDAERARFGVAPLAEMLARWPERNQN